MANSTKGRPRGKRSKPHGLVGLHRGSGRWCKKRNGHVTYLKKLEEDPDGKQSEQMWLRELEGDNGKVESPTVRDCCNRFMSSKRLLVESGEMAARSFAEYFSTCEAMCDVLGKFRPVDQLKPEHFEKLRAYWANRFGAVRLQNEIARARAVFNFAMASEWIEKPPRFGKSFERPNKKTLRLARAAAGVKLLSANEVRCLLAEAEADVSMCCMIQLGLANALGNSDIARLRERHLDLDHGWLKFDRPKTGVARRSKLWPSTVQLLRKVLADRPTPKDPADADRVFLNRDGWPWIKEASLRRDGTVSRATDAIGRHFNRLMSDLKIIKRGVGFYTLRHVARTAIDGVDDRASNMLMGHADSHISSAYVEKIDDVRLERLATHLWTWLHDEDPAPSVDDTTSAEPQFRIVG